MRLVDGVCNFILLVCFSYYFFVFFVDARRLMGPILLLFVCKRKGVKKQQQRKFETSRVLAYRNSGFAKIGEVHFSRNILLLHNIDSLLARA